MGSSSCVKFYILHFHVNLRKFTVKCLAVFLFTSDFYMPAAARARVGEGTAANGSRSSWTMSMTMIRRRPHQQPVSRHLPNEREHGGHSGRRAMLSCCLYSCSECVGGGRNAYAVFVALSCSTVSCKILHFPILRKFYC